MKRSYKFKITQIVEFLPTGDVKETEEKDFPVPPTLTFGHCPIKNLQIGDYLLVETEDHNTFKNFQRLFKPNKPLDPKGWGFASFVEERATLLSKFLQRNPQKSTDKAVRFRQGPVDDSSRATEYVRNEADYRRC